MLEYSSARADQPEVATDLNNLALLYYAQGKYAEVGAVADGYWRSGAEVGARLFFRIRATSPEIIWRHSIGAGKYAGGGHCFRGPRRPGEQFRTEHLDTATT